MGRSKVAVLIVGAGPVGLTAAAELSRLGIEVRIVDRLPGPSDQSRAVGVQPRTLESLYPLGITADLIGRGRRQTETQVLNRSGHRLAVMDFSSIPSRYPYVLDVPQPETEDVLRGAVRNAGVDVEYSTTLTGFNQTDDHVEVVLQTPTGLETVIAGWVVGADGARGVTRGLTGQRYANFVEENVAVLADVEADIDFPLNISTLITDADGGLSIHPMQGTRVRLGFAAPGADLASTPTLEEVKARCAKLQGNKVRIREAHWLSYYRSRSGLVPNLRIGRVLLAGDAAHVHPPAGGQGMNLGIQDAIALAWRLALVLNSTCVPALLDDYQVERHAVAGDVVEAARRLSQLMTSNSPASVVKRRVALFALAHVPGVARRRAETTAQLTVDYAPRGTVIQDSHGVAGRRFPNVNGLIDHASAPVTVEDLLLTPRHTQVYYYKAGSEQPHPDFTGPNSAVDSVVVTDGLGELGKVTGHDSGALLVRPDGYVAASTDTQNAATTLTKYLKDRLRMIPPASA